jgi:hypothetical protein
MEVRQRELGNQVRMCDVGRTARRTLVLAITVAALGFMGAPALADAADASPVLVMPASKTTLDVAAVVPASAGLDKSGPCRLVEVDRPGAAIPAQLVKAIAADGTAAEDQMRLIASVPPRSGAEGTRRFRVEPAKKADQEKKAGFRFKEVSDGSLGLWDGEKPVLVYNHGMITVEKVPVKDARRTRSSYIHPLWGLQGEILTDDAPADHTHHRGIFWSWPHVGIDGREYDLWMYNNTRRPGRSRGRSAWKTAGSWATGR